jgi:predicted nucleotidyltransferase
VSAEAGLNEDFLDLLRALDSAHVEYVVVGAHALAVHGIPRATGDLDIFVRPSRENAIRVHGALLRFGAPLAQHGIGATDFEQPDVVYQLGLPPRRIDLLTSISGVAFEEALRTAMFVEIAGIRVPFLGREAMLTNKRAAGREKDLLDVKLLERK